MQLAGKAVLINRCQCGVSGTDSGRQVQAGRPAGTISPEPGRQADSQAATALQISVRGAQPGTLAPWSSL